MHFTDADLYMNVYLPQQHTSNEKQEELAKKEKEVMQEKKI